MPSNITLEDVNEEKDFANVESVAVPQAITVGAAAGAAGGAVGGAVGGMAAGAGEGAIGGDVMGADGAYYDPNDEVMQKRLAGLRNITLMNILCFLIIFLIMNLLDMIPMD